MFAQLFLGLFFVVNGIVEHFVRKPSPLLSENIVKRISKDDLPRYRKKVGKVHILLGILIITMGQIEHRYNPELWIFLTVYIVLGLGCIAISVTLLRNTQAISYGSNRETLRRLIVPKEVVELDNDSKKPTCNHRKEKRHVVWNIFFTGGFSSFEKEWKQSKSPLQTVLLFLIPLLGAGVIVLIAVVLRQLF